MNSVLNEVLTLEAGECLSRDEFLRRWEASPRVKRAELIGGIVYMPSPLTAEHGDMEGCVGTWAGNYAAFTPGCVSGHNTTTFLLDDSPQPDVNLRVLAEFGGRSSVEDKYLEGAPELLIEVCRSSTSYDLNQKLNLYQVAAVPEYLTILLVEREVRGHSLEGTEYRIIPADSDGVHRSRIFPGLWLDGRSLFDGRMDLVLARLNEGLASPEHRVFVQKLAEAHTKRPIS